MTVTIGRRELLAALGGGAAAWPLAARAQRSAMPVIAFISGRAADASARYVAAFRQGPDTLMQLSRSLISEVHLYRTARPYIVALIGTREMSDLSPLSGRKRTLLRPLYTASRSGIIRCSGPRLRRNAKVLTW